MNLFRTLSVKRLAGGDCGSGNNVDANGTQSLLRTHRAIWCSPPGLRPWPAVPREGEYLWLVWREDASSGPVLLLGGGFIQKAPRNLFNTELLWAKSGPPGASRSSSATRVSGTNIHVIFALDADCSSIAARTAERNRGHRFRPQCGISTTGTFLDRARHPPRNHRPQLICPYKIHSAPFLQTTSRDQIGATA
jgi:hypothetical protein